MRRLEWYKLFVPALPKLWLHRKYWCHIGSKICRYDRGEPVLFVGGHRRVVNYDFRPKF